MLVGCQSPDTMHGPLRVHSSSWLVRPGSPSKFLNRQLASVIPASPSTADKQLFANYDADGPSTWAANWTRNLDFTGVAWDSAKAGTLIHQQYVVFASHFPRRLGEELTFHDREGVVVKRRIASKKIIHRVRTPDVTVARLDRPVPETIAHYPMLPLGHNYRPVLVGAPLIVTDKQRQVHLFRINRLERQGYEELGARPGMGRELAAAWRERLEKGDSGHPAFILINGRLILVSTLKGGGWASKGPFFGGRRLQTAIVAAMSALEPSEGDPSARKADAARD